VYRYGKLGSADGPLYILPQHVSKKVKPGLSSFAHKPTEAGSSLAGLVEFMKQQVPESDWPVTPIWFLLYFDRIFFKPQLHFSFSFSAWRLFFMLLEG
jgi:hypothetical protein